ncbi:MAG: YbhB/YbcL family Raf kinase inhibitor-like protein [Candidatus Omnitrophica bacterium]|nr:YbhB/YbcL family Raf kinase inhibitor-like protein [Candidatus Omnitrophota bacterium]MDE2222242.1 YbhB/YbcL family Raf kinase inhibitor-like protein [Candidatus Omnitrophota bacterium]
MKLTSNKFQHNEMIPAVYTCEGENINPPLSISDLPPQAQSLVLIVDDPDAPGSTFIHWVVYDIPVTGHIKENSVPGTTGINDFKRRNYGGPCPPSGVHHYYFKAYALDTKLDLPEGQTKAQIEKAMQGHVLDQDELIGLFSKERQTAGRV